MQARGSLGPLIKTPVESTSKVPLQQSRLLQTSSFTLARRHAGLCAVNSDCVLAGVEGNAMGLTHFLLLSSHAARRPRSP
jgi:hypothetical protein